MMDELNGRMIACQILITGLIARVANEQRDPLRFLTDFRDEIRNGKYRSRAADRATEHRRVVFADEAAERRLRRK
jgi:hypothetical protein